MDTPNAPYIAPSQPPVSPRLRQKLEDKGRFFNAISQEMVEQGGSLATAQGCPTLLRIDSKDEKLVAYQGNPIHTSYYVICDIHIYIP